MPWDPFIDECTAFVRATMEGRCHWNKLKLARVSLQFRIDRKPYRYWLQINTYRPIPIHVHSNIHPNVCMYMWMYIKLRAVLLICPCQWYMYVWLIYPYYCVSFPWHWGNQKITPVPMIHSWRIWVKSVEVLPQDTAKHVVHIYCEVSNQIIKV